MSTSIITAVRDYFFNERGVVPGLASWRRRLPYPTLVA